MTVSKSCPKCKSKDIRYVIYRGIDVRQCNTCGYDERSEYEEEAGQKTSQKAKARYTPYRTGGPKGKR